MSVTTRQQRIKQPDHLEPHHFLKVDQRRAYNIIMQHAQKLRAGVKMDQLVRVSPPPSTPHDSPRLPYRPYIHPNAYLSYHAHVPYVYLMHRLMSTSWTSALLRLPFPTCAQPRCTQTSDYIMFSICTFVFPYAVTKYHFALPLRA